MLDDRRAAVYAQKGWFSVAERDRLMVVMNVLALFEVTSKRWSPRTQRCLIP